LTSSSSTPWFFTLLTSLDASGDQISEYDGSDEGAAARGTVARARVPVDACEVVVGKPVDMGNGARRGTHRIHFGAGADCFTSHNMSASAILINKKNGAILTRANKAEGYIRRAISRGDRDTYSGAKLQIGVRTAILSKAPNGQWGVPTTPKTIPGYKKGESVKCKSGAGEQGPRSVLFCTGTSKTVDFDF
jgi:hypothetical protein